MKLPPTLPLRRVVVILGWSTVLVLCLIFVAPGLWTYATGTATTAHVDKCESRRGAGSTGTVWTCYGTWVIAGTRHSGKLEGVGRTNEGKDVQVRAKGSRVVPANTPRTALMTTGIFVGIGLVNHLLVVPQMFRSKSRPA